ncbi:EAL domain-containing protein [Lutimaribacter sp. EGI FJ00015]|uniref:EAL domain-containing protein n=1 Tax=Lutimaribacter degradans TaxID=2945989 RepID=A0ACC5ZYH2_9RHOB|nr:GGDEF domain-containing phosphodiesterase [Lutimaribacter sp. EGI FJ00013]MCM2563233.1 EAL domain-containing protein [Lutimaribacter sp. EGI FJ00013]MCO0614444.1 EAL domain-containing protein [Lutimaribacter sp. EGI FJ00015]MCO0635955.1 EAL domain-containing protein [Lutimaribacter sp. EGI FJ00014]
MPPIAQHLHSLRNRARHVVAGPPALAFMPAAILAAFWLGGEGWLVALALGLPVLFATLGLFERADATPNLARPNTSTAMDRALQRAAATGQHTACIIVQIDDFDRLRAQLGSAGAALIAARSLDRLHGATRDSDHVAQLQPGRFAVVLAPKRQLDLEIAIQLAGRLQTRLEEPVSIDAQAIYASCSVGFALDTQLRDATAPRMLQAAAAALEVARAHAPSAIRAYGPDMACTPATPDALADEVAQALENGEITPWFQPQVSTDTGQVSGFEALARWQHPERGLVAPADFLPAMERSDQLERLSEIILYHALGALRNWDDQGFDVPCVAVNFSGAELRNPKLVDKIRWELDRFDLAPGRLCIEVLETVVAASPDDIVARNINGLAAMGCSIDLDDFGTGHASISSIRRFAVSRLKIDRSFVRKVDRDPEQQRMVAAILTMADRLNMDVLAEGVENAGEHAMLAQLGCNHVQGFGIARPMPLQRTAEWLHAHHAKLAEPPRIGRGTA